MMFEFLVQFAEFLPYDVYFTEDLVMVVIGLMCLMLTGMLLMWVAAVLIAAVLLMVSAVKFVGGLLFTRRLNEVRSQLTSET